MRRFSLRRLIVPGLVMFLVFVVNGIASAQTNGPTIGDVVTATNIMWTFITGFLVFFMQAGFALVETGFTRSKNVAHTMMMNMMVFCIGAIGYWLVGFAFQFGGVGYTFPAIGSIPANSFAPSTLGDFGTHLGRFLIRFGQAGILGGDGFLLTKGVRDVSGILAFFLFQMVFMDTAATIPTGAMAERLKFSGFVLMGLWVSMVIYPLVGGWVWGGGWLANLGRTAGLGNGAVDFAGSGVVHMIGGAVAFAGAIAIGPRIGRFNKDGTANAMPGHNIPLGVLGTIILFFGWFGFNPGSSLAFVGGGQNLASNAAVNTLLAGGAGGVSAMLYMWWFGPTKKPDPGLSVNGVLAGLVAITSPCAFVNSTGAVLIGVGAGVIVCLAAFLLEKIHVDDPVGAVPVHFFNGIWGLLSVGIFSDAGASSAGWNGVAGPVTGLIFGGTTQILAQLLEILSILVVVGGLSFLFFKLLSALKLLRSNPQHELMGLDMPEMGAQGYSNIDVHMPRARLTRQIPGAGPSGGA
ncbi:MAG TPA: ammonium transporter [Spirochaetia bacterium]|nr:ammonium transporter [Spirochaetia bacterium]